MRSVSFSSRAPLLAPLALCTLLGVSLCLECVKYEIHEKVLHEPGQSEAIAANCYARNGFLDKYSSVAMKRVPGPLVFNTSYECCVKKSCQSDHDCPFNFNCNANQCLVADCILSDDLDLVLQEGAECLIDDDCYFEVPLDSSQWRCLPDPLSSSPRTPNSCKRCPSRSHTSAAPFSSTTGAPESSPTSSPASTSPASSGPPSTVTETLTPNRTGISEASTEFTVNPSSESTTRFSSPESTLSSGSTPSFNTITGSSSVASSEPANPSSTSIESSPSPNTSESSNSSTETFSSTTISSTGNEVSDSTNSTSSGFTGGDRGSTNDNLGTPAVSASTVDATNPPNVSASVPTVTAP